MKTMFLMSAAALLGALSIRKPSAYEVNELKGTLREPDKRGCQCSCLCLTLTE
jgi:hypothetical protein